MRRSLDFVYHLLHSDGTAITHISRRQDKGENFVPVQMMDSYYAMARLDGNSRFAAIADWLWDRGDADVPWALHPFVEHPEWRKDDLTRPVLPVVYNRRFEASGLWRVRRGDLSATVASGTTTPFSLQCGKASLALKLSSTYFGTGQFSGENLQPMENGVTLRHRGRHILPEGEYEGPVYWYPMGKMVSALDWNRVRRRRDHWMLTPLIVDLEIREVESGFDLLVRTTGGPEETYEPVPSQGVPFQIECLFPAGGELQLAGGVIRCAVGQSAFLENGMATYRLEEDAISIGPGNVAHRMWQMRNSEISSGFFRLLIPFTTPLETELQVRYGQWSSATRSVVG